MSQALAQVDGGAAQVANALRLFHLPGSVIEIRVLGVRKSNGYVVNTASGYFDDPETAAIAAMSYSGKSKGVYFTMNEADPSLLARRANRIEEIKGKEPTTADTNIQRRRWLLVDCDSKRPSGISASDAEVKAALEVADAIDAYLAEKEFPAPIRCDSGNGAHLLIPIDLPSDDAGLVERFLKALAARFDTETVKVDTSVHNPARITKLYGTLAAKGDDTKDRPWRFARVTREAVWDPAPLSLLESIAGVAQEHAVPQPGSKPSSRFDIGEWMDNHLPGAKGPESWANGPRKWSIDVCPFNSEHTGGPAFVAERSNGALAASCHHDSCTWNWQDLRERFEPGCYERSETQSLDNSGFYDRARVIAELAEMARLEVISASFPLLDEAIGGGLFITQLTTLIGPTGRGKSSLAMQIARSVNVPVLFWTLEMPPPLLAARAAAQISGDSSLAILRDPEVQGRNIVNVPSNIAYYQGKGAAGARAALKRIAPRGGGLLIVDYLQKAATSTGDNEVRSAVTAISEELRSMAIEERCAVLAISSTSRNGTRLLYESKKHAPHELEGCGKESGAIEYDSATVLTLGPDPDIEPLGSRVILTVAKARFGGCCQIEFSFAGAQGRWAELGKLASKGAREIDAKADDMLENFRADYREHGQPRSYTTIREFGAGANPVRKKAFQVLIDRRSLEVLDEGGSVVYRPALEVAS